MMDFSATECIKFGWETFKKRPWFFIGVFTLYFVVTFAVSYILAPFETVWPDPQNNIPADFSLPRIAVDILDFVISSFLTMTLIVFSIKVYDMPDATQMKDAWKPEVFLNYFVTTFLFMLICVIGFILLIVPGFIALSTFLFAPYIVVDKGMGPIAALKESMTITRGRRMEVFLFFIANIGVMILGALALVVGLLVAIPVTYFATVRAYRVLTAKAESIITTSTSTSAPVVG
ncbi:MAG TPA: hypothetical protein VI483_00985 [Candidatus Paceibacterota bacterium]